MDCLEPVEGSGVRLRDLHPKLFDQWLGLNQRKTT